MKKYVLLYEEFDPAKAKSKIMDNVKKIKDRMNRRKDRIKKAEQSKDKLTSELHKTRDTIDELQLQRLKHKNKVVDLKVKKKGN